jgi:hypothetical protein
MEQKTRTLTTLATLLIVNGFIELAHAQSPPSSTIQFPMIGVAVNQTLRLNVISFNPCTLQLAILDSDGTTVVHGSFPPASFKIDYNSLDVTYVPQTPSGPRRKAFRPFVTVQPATTSPCQTQATAEVFDGLTRTDWVVTPGLQPPGPNNMPLFLGPVGLIFEQTARLNVVALPPGPCFGTIGFTDTSGNPIGSPTPVSLGSNHATFVDLPGFQAGTALNSLRPEVIGVFTPSVTTTPGVCIASFEVFDRITGFTRILIPPGPANIPPGPTG